MRGLSFTAAERRALYFLLFLFAVGVGVRMYKRYNPGHAATYTIEVDTVPAVHAPAVNTAAERKLESGIDPNTAPQEDLELLPGIGPALARAIIADREEHGRYDSADALVRVPGIGAHKLEQMRPFLRFP